MRLGGANGLINFISQRLDFFREILIKLFNSENLKLFPIIFIAFNLNPLILSSNLILLT